MITRRRFMWLASVGAVGMGLLTPAANERYAPLDPSPTFIDTAGMAPTSEPWPELGHWELPGQANCVLPTGEGRCLVGGEVEEGSATSGYILQVGSGAERRTHRFDSDASNQERIADLMLTDDGVIALKSVGNGAHQLLRLTRDGKITAETATHSRETLLWFPRLLPRSEGDGLVLAGLPVSGSAWDEGLVLVDIAGDGTPGSTRRYGYRIEPNNIRSNGQRLATSVEGYSRDGVTAGVMVVDGSGLRYHRPVPGRAVYDIGWVGESSGDMLVVGSTNDPDTDTGYVARLDPSGSPRWWRNLTVAGRSTALSSIVQSDRVYRIQGTVQPPTEDGEPTHFELDIDPAGAVRELRPVPEDVFGGWFRSGTVFVIEHGDEPRVVQYRDANRLEGGELA